MDQHVLRRLSRLLGEAISDLPRELLELLGEEFPVVEEPDADSCWVPPGTPVSVAGYTIPNGMVYVGSGLRPASGYRRIEPALIDPTLPVRKSARGTVSERDVYPWRAYSELSQTERGMYLQWLAEGRKAPDAPVHHVMLFFFGLERRLIWDSRRRPEVLAEAGPILDEVRRLRELYDGYSFRRRADTLIRAVNLMQHTPLTEPVSLEITQGAGLPFELKQALGHIVEARKPVPADLALAWFISHPDARVSTLLERCREELQELWRLRYREKFGEGLVAKAGRTRLSLDYYPASPALQGTPTTILSTLPDVSRLKAPIQKFAEIHDECRDALSAYSRWLATHPEGGGALPAVARLPTELRGGEAVAELGRWLGVLMGDREWTFVPSVELIRRWDAHADKLSSSDGEYMARLLEGLGYGIEPDSRRGSPLRSGGDVVLFRLPPDTGYAPLRPYFDAVPAVDLAAVVTAGHEPSVAQRAYLASYLSSLPDMAPRHTRRLMARFEWRKTQGRKLTGFKARVARLEPEERADVGQFIVGLATLEGAPSPDVVALLTKGYRLLGLPEGAVYSDIHSRITSPPDEPVTVRAAGTRSPGYAIPRRTAAGQRVALDAARIKATMTESEAASTLLGAIFTDDEADTPRHQSQDIRGLDSAHSELLHRLAVWASWPRSELEQLSAQLGLMPDGALDTINEVAIELTGEPLCAGDDPIELDPEVLEEMLI